MERFSMKETVFLACGSTLSYRDLCKHYAWFSLENAVSIAVSIPCKRKWQNILEGKKY